MFYRNTSCDKAVSTVLKPMWNFFLLLLLLLNLVVTDVCVVLGGGGWGRWRAAGRRKKQSRMLPKGLRVLADVCDFTLVCTINKCKCATIEFHCSLELVLYKKWSLILALKCFINLLLGLQVLLAFSSSTTSNCGSSCSSGSGSNSFSN